jgi:hypothetical protein
LLVALATGAALLGWASVPALVLPAAPATAAQTATSCSSGVIVAVDFDYGSWGGNINSVCDPTPPVNAVEVLQAAHFLLTGVADNLDFICQIDGYPQNGDCSSTPPADAYWSFWYADACQSTWTYSMVGAMSLEPQAGSVEAWVFGGQSGSGQPSDFPSPSAFHPVVACSPVSTTATAPAAAGSTPSPTGSPTITGAASSTGVGSGPTDGTGVGAHPPSKASPAAATTSTTSPGGSGGSKGSASDTTKPPSAAPVSKSASRSTSSPKIVDAAPAVSKQTSGSPLPFLIGAVAIAGLAASGGLIAWRRRRTG